MDPKQLAVTDFAEMHLQFMGLVLKATDKQKELEELIGAAHSILVRLREAGLELDGSAEGNLH